MATSSASCAICLLAEFIAFYLEAVSDPALKRPPTGLDREALSFIIHLAGQASTGRSALLQGLPHLSSNTQPDESRSDSSRGLSSVSVDASDIALNRSRVRTGSTTSGHRRSSSAAPRRAVSPESTLVSARS
jgi:hypothetical protein